MVLVGKPERRTPHGRHRHRWEDCDIMVLNRMGERELNKLAEVETSGGLM